LIWLSQEKSAKDAHRFDRSHVLYMIFFYMRSTLDRIPLSR
jgi:hypothetical protein